MDDSPIRLEPRAALAIGALSIIILAIIFVELCGRQDVKPLVQVPEQQSGIATATLGPTFTPGPSPTVGPTVPTQAPTPMPGGNDRDAQRVADLQSVQAALQQYQTQNGEVPTTGDGVQTLCAFVEVDAGCALLDVIDQLPVDPLGDPSVNGYWYQSNGSTYTLYAQREADVLPACQEPKPEFLQDFDSLFCLTGP